MLAGSTETSTEARPKVENPPNGIWIRNFVFDVNEEHLVELFGKFGDVVEVRIVRDPRGLSKGYTPPKQRATG
jgi:nucleolin